MEDEVIEIDRDNLKENMKMSFEGSLRDSNKKGLGEYGLLLYKILIGDELYEQILNEIKNEMKEEYINRIKRRGL